MTKRAACVAALALVAVGSVSATAGAQDQEPLPPGLPQWNWQQAIASPATVWVCRQRVTRHGDRVWRVNLVARSKETQWQVSASARLQRWPRKRTLDDWSSGILEPGEVSRVGHVIGDVDSNDRIAIGAGHRNGPNEGMGLGDVTAIRDLNRC
jgi:hypothetical protein